MPGSYYPNLLETIIMVAIAVSSSATRLRSLSFSARSSSILEIRLRHLVSKSRILSQLMRRARSLVLRYYGAAQSRRRTNLDGLGLQIIAANYSSARHTCSPATRPGIQMKPCTESPTAPQRLSSHTLERNSHIEATSMTESHLN